MLKADLHVHTGYSMDCGTSLEQVIDRCRQTGINCVAIADHGTIEGAAKLQKIAPFRVIVAEEILTPHGEVMGMFLKETVPSGLSLEQAIQRIRAQGGLVCVPHPFDTIRQSALTNLGLEGLAGQIDAIEVFNSRSLLPGGAARARAFAEKYAIPKTAGSDAHTAREIGNAYVEMPEFNGAEDFIGALVRGRILGHRTNPLTHFNSVWSRVRKRLK